MEIIASYQTSAFAVPVNGTPDDADQVRGNDNTLRAALNSHDADGGIHFQSSPIATRPAAGSLGRKWLASDTLRVYFDDGSNWQEIAYVPLAGGVALTLSSLIVTGNITCGAFLHAAGALTVDNNGTLSNITITAGAALALAASNGSISLNPSTTIDLKIGGATKWQINAAGHLIGGADGTQDIGLIGGSRVRTIFQTGSTVVINSGGTKLLGVQHLGWTTDPTGTLSRLTFVSDSVTLPNLAARVAALIIDLRDHGLIAP